MATIAMLYSPVVLETESPSLYQSTQMFYRHVYP